MRASCNGHLDIVCTLLEGGANLNDKNNVRNQMMMNTINYLDYDDDDDDDCCYQ